MMDRLLETRGSTVSRPVAVIVGAMMAAGLASTGVAAQSEETYYGCITPDSVLISVGVGEAPADHCAETDVLIAWNAMGPEGPAGAKGDQGAKGDKGAKGPQGEPGAAGADGKNGPQGDPGPAGEPGPAGADGAAGADGEQGLPGEPGPAGADGKPGPQGEPGAAGAAGADGADGEQGPQGESGPAGADGKQGPQGEPGADGADGEQGPQGEPGLAGADGADGEQGPQGEQGPPIESASGFALVPVGSRLMVVEPGVEVGPGTVVMVTPMANLHERSFWVTKSEEEDLFAIRLSSPRKLATPFGWLIVESDEAAD